MIENSFIYLDKLNSHKYEFINGINDDELCAMYGFTTPVDGERVFQQFIQISHAYGVYRKSDDTLVGFVLSVEPEIPEQERNHLPAKGRTLAFAIFPPYQRQGYMYEALTLLLEHLFRFENVEYVHCGRFPQNEKSAKLLNKLGFSIIGSHQFKESIIVDEILIKNE